MQQPNEIRIEFSSLIRIAEEAWEEEKKTQKLKTRRKKNALPDIEHNRASFNQYLSDLDFHVIKKKDYRNILRCLS